MTPGRLAVSVVVVLLGGALGGLAAYLFGPWTTPLVVIFDVALGWRAGRWALDD